MADKKNNDGNRESKFNWRDYDALRERFETAAKNWSRPGLTVPMVPSVGACAVMATFLLTSQIEEIWERWNRGMLSINPGLDLKKPDRQLLLVTVPRMWGKGKTLDVELDLNDPDRTKAFVDGSTDPSPFVIDAVSAVLWS